MALELLAYVCFSEPSTSSRSHLQMGAYFEHTKLIIICSCTCTSQALALCTKLLQLHLAPPSCNQCLSDAMLGNKAQQMYVCREKGQVLPNLPCNCHRLLNSRGGDPGRDPSPTAESIVLIAHLEHLQRKKKLRCSSRRRADSGRLTSMYEMVSSALFYMSHTGSAYLQACCGSDMTAMLVSDLQA